MAVVHATASTIESPMLTRSVNTSSLLLTADVTVGYVRRHQSSACSDAPFWIAAAAECNTEPSECSLDDPTIFGGSGDAAEFEETYIVFGCSDDWASVIDTVYGNEPYLRIDYYADADCTTFDGSTASLADGDCHAYPALDSTNNPYTVSLLKTINADGSASRTYYGTGDCSGEPSSETAVTAALLSSSACSEDGTVAYTNVAISADSTADEDEEEVAADTDDSGRLSNGGEDAGDDAGLSTGAIVGIVVGAVAVVAIVAGLVVWRRRKSSGDNYRETTQ